MNAQAVDHGVDYSAPFVLTELAEAALAVAEGQALTYTAAEAARILGLGRAHVMNLARTGVLDAVQVDDQPWPQWLIDGASLVTYGAEHPHRWVTALPRAVAELALVPAGATRAALAVEHDDDPECGNLLRERVPAGPLLRQIELDRGDGRLVHRLGDAEQAAIERARHEGTLTIHAADQLAVRLLGLTLWDFYDL